MSTDVLRALIRAGWRGDASHPMSGGVTEHVLTHPAAGVALSVRPDGQIVGVGATGAPDALADAVRAVAAALGGETAPLDLAALSRLSRLAADAGLPWEHDGGGEIVRAGAGSAGWIGETLHGADPDATRRYAEYIVAACNALPGLLAEVARLRELERAARAWRVHTDDDDPEIEPDRHVADLIDAVDALDADAPVEPAPRLDWTDRESRVFNAVTRALRERGRFAALSDRVAVTAAVVAVLAAEGGDPR